MNGKIISIVSVSAAVVIAAFAAIYVTNGRSAVARAELEKAELAKDAAKEAAKKANAEATAARANAEAKADAAKAAEANLKAKEAERETARLASEKAKTDKETALANRAKAEAEAQASSDAKQAEKAKAETARSEAEKAKSVAAAEASKAEAAEAALEKERLVAEKVIAEAKAYELKQLDLATFERELLDFKRELDERELALRPEKTIEDLVWVSKDDTVFDENGVAKKKEKVPYLAEEDRSLPRATRALAKAERLLREESDVGLAEARATTIGVLEKLYVEALRKDQAVNAEFYRNTIKSTYPDWKFQPPEN